MASFPADSSTTFHKSSIADCFVRVTMLDREGQKRKGLTVLHVTYEIVADELYSELCIAFPEVLARSFVGPWDASSKLLLIAPTLEREELHVFSETPRARVCLLPVASEGRSHPLIPSNPLFEVPNARTFAS